MTNSVLIPSAPASVRKLAITITAHLGGTAATRSSATAHATVTA